MSTVEIMDACGLVGPWLSAAHAIWISDTDMDLLARKGAQVSHNAGANLRLGSGIAAVREYMRHGVTVGIGTDGSASSDNQNMFEAMRAAAFVSRVRGLPPADWISTAEAFSMATEGSARVLGMQDFIGKIAKGYKADLVLLDLDNVNFIPLNDATNQIVFTENGGAVDKVLIGGKLVVAGGTRHRHRPCRPRGAGRCGGGAPRRAQRGSPPLRRAHRAHRVELLPRPRRRRHDAPAAPRPRAARRALRPLREAGARVAVRRASSAAHSAGTAVELRDGNGVWNRVGVRIAAPRSIAMHQILSQILQFLQQGISAIFRFVELIWNWSVDQIGKLVAVPWHDWPVLKILLLIVVAVAVIWALYRAAWQLWLAAERTLAAFAGLLVVLVHTLPRVLLAGVIALGGVWVINHLDNSLMHIPMSLQVWQQAPPPSDHP